MILIIPHGDFNEMKPELGFDRALRFTDGSAENDFIEFFNHLAGAKRTECTALLAGRAGRMLFCG